MPAISLLEPLTQNSSPASWKRERERARDVFFVILKKKQQRLEVGEEAEFAKCFGFLQNS
ncbi:MAG TPA: hypothetical protein VMA13_09105 [Candidatus Saccharimonadales bacterium]|nr:hypothetical protein [Candidatus Saccharimonadales bacterium]